MPLCYFRFCGLASPSLDKDGTQMLQSLPLDEIVHFTGVPHPLTIPLTAELSVMIAEALCCCALSSRKLGQC